MSKAKETKKVLDPTNTKGMLNSMKLRGAYAETTAWMRKKQIYTAIEIIDFLKSMGKTETSALATANVLLSPRKESTRGDCRGNRSNPWGHLAYNDKLPIRVLDGVKENQRFRFRFRNEALEPRKRSEVMKVEGEKVEAVEIKTPSPVEAEPHEHQKAVDTEVTE